MKLSTSLSFRSISFIILLILFSTNSFSQVGIGTVAPDSDSVLDITSTDKGALLPRVNLSSTTSFAPLSAHVAGMIVYNLATINDVTPGYYYNNGSAWVSLGEANDEWKLNGNSSTTPGPNYLGTSDAVDLYIGTAGVERLRLVSDGRVSVNGAPLFGVDRFTSIGAASEYAINGYSITDGVGVYGENTGTGYGVFGNAANIGVLGLGGAGIDGVSGIATGFGVVAENTNALGTGLLAYGNNATASYLISGTGIASNGENGLFAYGRAATGTGVIGSGNDGLIFTLVGGSGVAGTGTGIGVFGLATTTTDTGFGGYFFNNGGYAYVGGWLLTGPPGPPTLTQYKIIGLGAVATIVKDQNENPIVMFAPEAPEILFQDYGIGKLTNGMVHITLDPNLSKNIRVNAQHPLKVFVQLEGDCNGVYVTNKSANGFTVIELQGGTSNVDFAWSIVATRANEEIVGKNGNIRISDNSVRFPAAPGPMEKTDIESSIANKFDTKNSKKSKQ